MTGYLDTHPYRRHGARVDWALPETQREAMALAVREKFLQGPLSLRALLLGRLPPPHLPHEFAIRVRLKIIGNLETMHD